MELTSKRISNDLLESAAGTAERRRNQALRWNENDELPGDFGLTLSQWVATLRELRARRREAWHRRAEGIATGMVLWSIAACTARAIGVLP